MRLFLEAGKLVNVDTDRPEDRERLRRDSCSCLHRSQIPGGARLREALQREGRLTNIAELEFQKCKVGESKTQWLRAVRINNVCKRSSIYLDHNKG